MACSPANWLISAGMAEISHAGSRNFFSPLEFKQVAVQKRNRKAEPLGIRRGQ
jgi:hypothetical protein